MLSVAQLVRPAATSIVAVQNFIVRAGTPLTAGWLRLVHRHLDIKLPRLRAHPAPARFPRCCFHHEFGYPMNWAELKGDILQPLMRQYRAHVAFGLPGNGGLVGDREEIDVLGEGKFGWIDGRQPK
jgi:hypothetical protein